MASPPPMAPWKPGGGETGVTSWPPPGLPPVAPPPPVELPGLSPPPLPTASPMGAGIVFMTLSLSLPFFFLSFLDCLAVTAVAAAEAAVAAAADTGVGTANGFPPAPGEAGVAFELDEVTEPGGDDDDIAVAAAAAAAARCGAAKGERCMGLRAVSELFGVGDVNTGLLPNASRHMGQ